MHTEQLRTGMRQAFDVTRFDAFTRLLARPDPKELPRRGHVNRYQGDPARRGTRLPDILMAWMQRRHLEIEIDETLEPERLLEESSCPQF
jgi:hypothetical protein